MQSRGSQWQCRSLLQQHGRGFLSVQARRLAHSSQKSTVSGVLGAVRLALVIRRGSFTLANIDDSPPLGGFSARLKHWEGSFNEYCVPLKHDLLFLPIYGPLWGGGEP